MRPTDLHRDNGTFCSQAQKGHSFPVISEYYHHRQVHPYLTQMRLQFLHFSVFWGVKHHFVFVSHLPGIIRVQVVRLRRRKPETQVDYSHLRDCMSCLSNVCHMQTEKALNVSWEAKGLNRFHPIFSLFGGTKQYQTRTKTTIT